MMIYNHDFVFRDYSLSHSKVLLRSEQHFGNIDIIFLGVLYIDVEVNLKNIALRMATNKEMDTFRVRFSEYLLSFIKMGTLNIYIIESNQHNYCIVAGKVKVYQNNLNTTKSSLDFEHENYIGELLEEL